MGGTRCRLGGGGAWHVVILSSEIAYEAYPKSEFFNDCSIGALGAVSDGRGILFVNKKDIRTEQRRFGLNTLRLFGMGRRTLKPQLIELSRRLCEKIDSLSPESESDFPSQAIDVRPMFYEITSSVISCVIFGSDITAEDKEFDKVLKKLGMSGKLSFLDVFLTSAPFLKHVFPFSYASTRAINFDYFFVQCSFRFLRAFVLGLLINRGGVEDTRLEAKAKNSVSEDRTSRGQGQECSRLRPRTQAQVYSKKKRSSKIFSGDFQFIGVPRIFGWGRPKPQIT